MIRLTKQQVILLHQGMPLLSQEVHLKYVMKVCWNRH